jgi:hypothetical protein
VHLQSMRAVLHCHIMRFLRKSTLPELSNFGESPGRAGGLPFELNTRIAFARGDIRSSTAFSPRTPAAYPERESTIIMSRMR